MENGNELAAWRYGWRPERYMRRLCDCGCQDVTPITEQLRLPSV